MIRAIVNVATTPQYSRGQARLLDSIRKNSPGVGFDWRGWTDLPSTSCPPHDLVPYAFKAYALRIAANYGGETLLWCDSSIVCLRDLTPLFERIEREGYWIARNGWTNYEWTADSAYPDLFPDETLDVSRVINKQIPHVVATAFGVSTRHPTGKAILDEYYRLANTKAFCGPWRNAEWTGPTSLRRGICGPADVLGHRHDQTALSVIAWRLGCQLTNCPEIFAYYDKANESTILAAKGIG